MSAGYKDPVEWSAETEWPECYQWFIDILGMVDTSHALPPVWRKMDFGVSIRENSEETWAI